VTGPEGRHAIHQRVATLSEPAQEDACESQRARCFR
jgi:hypothetical protein